MKKLFFFALVLVTSLNLKAQNTTVLQEGEIVNVKLSETIDGKTAKAGDQIEFEVLDSIIADSIVVIERGAPVKGRILSIKEPKLAGLQGELEISIDYTVAIDGQNIRLQSVQELEGKSKTNEVVVAALVLHPLFLLFKGKEAIIEKGTVFSAYIDEDYTITY